MIIVRINVNTNTGNCSLTHIFENSEISEVLNFLVNMSGQAKRAESMPCDKI